VKVWFLGTGTSQGIPVIGSDDPVCRSSDPRDKRLRVSAWIHGEGYSFVIDCGPDFRQQMLASGCPRVDAILFTHEHADHTAGLDDIRPFNFKQGDIPVYGHQRVLENLRERFDYIFTVTDKYPGAPTVDPREVRNDVSFEIAGKTIVPVEVMHGRLQAFGYRIDDFAYLTDVKTVDEAEIGKLRNLDVLVVNALREEPHDTHFNLSEALAFIEKVNPKRAYLTHISHKMGFHAAVQEKLPPNVYLAYDNLEITI
jgi:phosphoribosyl 1,2-cyclic phosphate phosphodiesterase